MRFVQVEKTYSQQSFFDFLQIQGIKELLPSHDWPRGLMDKASDIGLEDLGFESLRGRFVLSQNSINAQQSKLFYRFFRRKVPF